MSFEIRENSAENQIVLKSNSPEETAEIGSRLGRQAAAIFAGDRKDQAGSSGGQSKGGALVVLLGGELGSGKTCLVRGVINQLIPGSRVTSPTYTFLNDYQAEGFIIYHADLYRLNSAEELDYLGLYDLLEESCLLLVEWPELFREYCSDYLEIIFERTGEQGRRLSIRAAGERSGRLMKGLKEYEDTGH